MSDKTECCGVPLAADDRFCRKCGYEARANSASLDPWAQVQRVQFEQWITAPPFEREIHRQGQSNSWPGQYHDYQTQLAWEAWLEAVQQSRAHLEEKDRRISTLEDAAFHFQTCRTCGEDGEDSCESGKWFAAFLRGEHDGHR